MVQFIVTFENNPQAIYYAGSVVNARVDLLVQNPTNVRGITLTISGKAQVYWTEEKTDHYIVCKVHYTQEYKATENYFESSVLLFGRPDGAIATIGAGTHCYTFSCVIPQLAPSSAEGKYGHIRYGATVEVHQPSGSNISRTFGFTVLKVKNLSLEDPSIRMASTMEKQQIFCCWPCASQPYVLQASIPQSGYVSGQHIPVTISICNESGKKTRMVVVYLRKIIKCTTDTPKIKTKTKKAIVKEVSIKSIQNLPKEDLHVDLLVPALPPMCPPNDCRIIQIYYELRIEARMSNIIHNSPEVFLPIAIGNVPLYDYNNWQAEIGVAPETYAFKFGLPPPTYEDAPRDVTIFESVSNKPLHKDVEFNPVYPVYSFNSAASPPYAIPLVSTPTV